ncbi:85/88 kDa calcium-independent phospholipase A2 isoform X1 [Dermacentor silvarum]|uniref:85/88 kDa calcium-independent phospholipase A2 isoform X1 n=1 Tax=Dermacentor silvarum TaxID=543639 RepID=UPI001896F996|nr:85/88 kDa calcium-independent phospholipase A2 isoform X1 [Dermacentor silvarum]XP_037557483.1 85/88 kDa calcium-independent phospholipase A2 isoform X1 [Dermacentor silvarum]XP_037557564.1 85/88 kDa calcium-independent phospholipase A2 isoform X1 [Dermacentor silvarum]XP_037557566.1 85/88 kDa calcium-independent phospholipase A2 isoform X1 [Dermacentor silvarum]
MAFLRGFLDNLRSNRMEPEPNKVLEVKPDEYALCNILAREDSLVVYQYPASTPVAEDSVSYDVVLHKDITRSPHAAFSLLRTKDQVAAEMFFMLLKDKLPLLLECVPDLLTKELVQEVVQLVRSNPTWNLAHLAAHLGLVDCFKNTRVAAQISEPAQDTMATPLHVAVRAQKLNSVQVLMAMDAPLNLIDHNGDTIYHAAAVTTKELIKALGSRPAPVAVINQVNNDGYTPLQLACLTDKPECVRELLKEGADVNSASVNLADRNNSTCLGRDNVEQNVHNFQLEDMKHGGTPLHWAKTTQCLETMIDLGCDLDAKNFQGNTALHIMVARGRLSCVISLLSHGANVNAIGSDGDSPLHVAVRVAVPNHENWSIFLEQSDVSLIHALIVFGADVNQRNQKGETARHLAAVSKLSKKDAVLYTLHAVGAQRCEQERGCSDGCNPTGTFDGAPPDKPDFLRTARLYDELMGASIVREAVQRRLQERREGRQQPRSRVLCLDGGGIRGLIIIQMLVALEAIIGQSILDCFDWAAGTSTGGVLALLLARGKTPRQCLQLYFSLKDKVFTGTRPHDADSLEKFLQRELGEDTVMTDIKHPKLMITGVLADRHPAALHLFRNYDSPKKILGVAEDESEFPSCTPPHEQLVWRAARASGAAPTYFRPFGRFLDGGLISNNPTLDAMTEICEYNEALKATGQVDKVRPLGVIVSLGTGKVPVVPVTVIDMLHMGTGILGAAKMAFGAKALGQLIIDQATQANGRLVDRAQAWCHTINVPYFRLNAPISADVCLNETDNKLLVRVLWETLVYMRARRAELDELAELLRP